MKKRWWLLLVIAIATALFLWRSDGRDSLGDSPSLYYFIPERSNIVVAINPFDLAKELITGSFLSFDELLSLRKESGNNYFYKKLLVGFYDSGVDHSERILFCFRINEGIENVTLLMKINNPKKFNKYIQQLRSPYQFKAKTISGKEIWYSDSLQCYANWNDERCAFVFSPKEDEKAILSVIKSQNNKKHPVEMAIIESHPICLWIKENALTNKLLKKNPETVLNIELNGKKVELEGWLKNKDQKHFLKKQCQHIQMNDSALVQFWCGINTPEFSFSDFTNDSTIDYINTIIRPIGISTSLIEKNYNGDISFERKKNTLIEEQIISYDFDENFNKTRKVKTKRTSINCFSGHLGCENDSILYELTKHKKIQQTDGKKILTSIPTSKIQLLTSKKNIYFLSPPSDKKNVDLKQDSLSFFLKARLNELFFIPDSLSFPFNKFSNIELVMYSKDTSIYFTGKLE